MNKKGIVVMAMFMAALFALTASYIAFASHEKSPVTSAVLGERHAGMLQTYLKGEQVMLNLEQAARLAAAQSLRETYARFNIPGCEKDEGYVILNSCSITQKQMETEFLANNQGTFSRYLNTIKKEMSLKEFPQYQSSLKDKKILNIAGGPINLSNEFMAYHMNPNVTIAFETGFNTFIDAINKLKEKKECLAAYNELEGEQSLITRCSLEYFDAWKLKRKENTLFFDVTKNTKRKFIGNIDTRFAISLKTTEEKILL